MKRSSSARKLRRLYTYSFANEKGMMATREFNEVPHASSRSRNGQIALYDSGLHLLRLIPDICILSSSIRPTELWTPNDNSIIEM